MGQIDVKKEIKFNEANALNEYPRIPFPPDVCSIRDQSSKNDHVWTIKISGICGIDKPSDALKELDEFNVQVETVSLNRTLELKKQVKETEAQLLTMHRMYWAEAGWAEKHLSRSIKKTWKKKIRDFFFFWRR